MNNAYVQLKFSSKIGALGIFDSIFRCLELDDFTFIGSVFISATFEHRKTEDEKSSFLSTNQENLIFTSILSKSKCENFFQNNH